jgi:2-C-methyl-D-erythritol 2,4-cyclodiphosphate synthase
LVLGHVAVDYDQGLVGHSDGDVLLHAIIDALAGAAGLPDIGEMFPDNDPAYKDADSGKLLEEVVRRVKDRGYAIANVDAIIHAQRPKLSKYKPAIRREVAKLLGVPTEAVSIKAKTNEGLDATGRGEAIASTAIVGLLSSPQ